MVGILIPTYNRLSYLKEALGSALAQTYGETTVLVIDDGSIDGTADYLREIRDPRFSYSINERNLGLANNINKGINLLPERADWCTILCDDDLLDKEFVRKMVDAVGLFAPNSVTHGHRVIIDDLGNPVRNAKEAPTEEDAWNYLANRLLRRRETFITGVFFRKQMFRRIGGYPTFRTGAMADDAFIFALALQDRLVFARTAVAKQRFHAGAESHSFLDISAILETTRQFRSYCEEMSSRSGNMPDTSHTVARKLLEDYGRVINSESWLQCYRNMVDRNARSRLIATLMDVPRMHPEAFSRRTRMDSGIIRKLRICPEDYIAYRACWHLLEAIANRWREKRMRQLIHSARCTAC